jgi:hypothetical protein
MIDVSDTEPPEILGKDLKEQSLKAAGIAYIVGDAALIFAKLMEGTQVGAGGAALWLGGGLAAAKYGNPKAEQRLKLLEQRLGQYLKKQGVKIPENPMTADLVKVGGVLDHIEAFLYTYPSQLLNALFAVGGALTIKGGIGRSKSDLACGALVMAGALGGLLIPERKPDREHPTQGMLGKAWEWAQEKPLRVSSTFFHANNIFTITSAFEQMKKNPAGKSHWFRFLTAASYIFGNIMLSQSLKDNISAKDQHRNEKVLEALAEASGQVIAAQPKEVQEVLVQNIAGYLSSQKEIKTTAPEIAKLLHAQLAVLRDKTPAAGQWRQRAQTAQPETPSL